MGWIKIRAKTLEFVGKLGEAEGFEEWFENQRQSLMERMALDISGKLFKERSAKKLIWDDLTSQFQNNPMFTTTIGGAVNGYFRRVYNVAKSEYVNLPSMNEITVLPRCVVNSWERIFWQSEFGKSSELAKLKGGPLVRSYFFDEMARQLDTAFSELASKSSPDKPLSAEDYWIIGFNRSYQWLDSNGHYYVFRSPKISYPDNRKTKREARQEAGAALDSVEKWLFKLTEEERKALSQELPVAPHPAMDEGC